MHRRLLPLALLCMACLSACGAFGRAASPADIPSRAREAVAYVEGHPPEGLRDMLLDIAQNPKVDDDARAAFIGYFRTRWSGSGGYVVATDAESSDLLVTNRHVAEGAAELLVSFDGRKTMARADILHIDDVYDLAVVKLPARRAGFRLATTPPRDLQEVISIGYPAIFGQGSYQIAKGVVSNHCLKGSFIGEPGDHCWVQHTAPIDPGSSGGVLLSTEGEIVGVNTAYVPRRNSLFLAIPASAMREVLARAAQARDHEKDRAWMTAGLRKACQAFVHEMTSKTADQDKLVPAVSYRLVTKKGLKAFDEVSNGPRARNLRSLIEEDPLAAIQMSITAVLREQFTELDGAKPDEACAHLNPSDDVLGGGDVRIMVELREGHMDLSWRFERGAWRLSGY